MPSPVSNVQPKLLPLGRLPCASPIRQTIHSLLRHVDNGGAFLWLALWVRTPLALKPGCYWEPLWRSDPDVIGNPRWRSSPKAVGQGQPATARSSIGAEGRRCASGSPPMFIARQCASSILWRLLYCRWHIRRACPALPALLYNPDWLWYSTCREIHLEETNRGKALFPLWRNGFQ